MLIYDTIRHDVVPQRKFDVLLVCSAFQATFISDYEYEIDYEYQFSNKIYLPPIITYHNNLILILNLIIMFNCVLVSNGKKLRLRG